MRRFAVELILGIMLTVTSVDLIYLYLARAWYDPSKLIETAELICISTFTVLGLVYVVWRTKLELKNVAKKIS